MLDDHTAASTKAQLQQAILPSATNTGSAQTNEDLIKGAMKRLDYSTMNLRTIVDETSGPRRSSNILSAYTDDHPFSLDLAAAVIRQGSFIDRMHAIGWTDASAFDSEEDEVVLVNCIARYHA